MQMKVQKLEDKGWHTCAARGEQLALAASKKTRALRAAIDLSSALLEAVLTWYCNCEACKPLIRHHTTTSQSSRTEVECLITRDTSNPWIAFKSYLLHVLT